MAGAKSTPQASTMSFAGGQSSSTPDTIDEFQRLKTSGDVMIGAIAYLPKITVIDGNGAIDLQPSDVLGSTSDDYTSYLLVTPVGSADDLKTISNASAGGQILHLEANTTGTITLKHNTGNIFIPSTNDHIIEAGGFATLIFDEVIHANKWVLVSSSKGGSSSWVGTATSDLDMATYDIKGVDTVYFNASGTNDATIDGSTAGLSHNVATGDVHTFQINSNTKLQITNTAINVYEDIDSDSGATFAGSVTINGAVALGNASTDLIFASGRFNTSLIPNTDNDVDLGSSDNEWRHLYVDGTANLDTISAGATTTNTLFTTSTTSLGDGDTDQVNFYGKTDWKTNTTASSAATGNREGYITIKINGTDKKLYYYS